MGQKRLSILCCLLFFWFEPILAQNKEVSYGFSVQPLYSKLFIHSKSISDLSGTTGQGIQLDINRYRLDERAYQYAHRHYNSGYTIQYIRFSNQVLGEALNLAYFIEPFLLESKRASLRLRAAGGINFASHPYHIINNPDNSAYSSRVNGYLGLGMSLNIKLSKHLGMFVNGTYSHFSNGNTKNPNYGVNYPNVGMGLEYRMSTVNKPLGKLLFYQEHWRFDLIPFVCNKSLPITPTKRYWAYGVSVQTSYRLGAIHGITLGAEAYTDQSMRKAMDSSLIYGPQHLSDRVLGLLVGHEFLFNRCIFSQQLGVYLFKEVPEVLINKVYHRWGFNYKLSRNFMLGINLNSNLQKAFILDGRLVMSIYGRKNRKQ